jgi:DNA repair exonuclease SbcCD ATPase subunit
VSTALMPLAPSLFELEQDLQALFDSAELVTQEQETEFLADISEALQRSVEKRDRVAQFITHCGHQRENCDSEIKRLESRKRRFELAETRMRQYVQTVIESIGPNDKGKFPKLEGKTATFSLRAKPPSVAIADENAVPTEFKSLTVTVRLSTWQQLLEAAGFDLVESESSTVSIRKTEIRKAIEAGQEVPGADLRIGEHTLQIK